MKKGIIIQCKKCCRDIYVTPSRIKRNKQFCSKQCKQVPQAVRAKIANSLLGHIVSLETKEKISINTKEAMQSAEIRAKIGKANQSGNLARNWKGGITFLLRGTRYLSVYKKWRKQILLRDNYSCQNCGRKHNIEVDHIIPLVQILHDFNIKTLQDAISCKQLWELDNGRSLCQPCHKQTPTYGRRLVL